MANRRRIIMDAVKAAVSLHTEFGIKDELCSNPGRVHVFDLLDRNNIPCLFQPLDGLLGAYINSPYPGVLISTKRPKLSIQRFTAAHELGHAVLEHQSSLDNEAVIARSPFDCNLSGDEQEIAANVFAVELLMPKWLIVAHMKKQSWQSSDFNNPSVVYQLSLRMGVSYSATCHTLLKYKAISADKHHALINTKPKSIKEKLSGKYVPENWRGDFWYLTEQDTGLSVHASIEDTLIVSLSESASSGYQWFLENADQNVDIVEDWRETFSSNSIGGVINRKLAIKPKKCGYISIEFNEYRPWLTDADPIESVELGCMISDPERRGLSDMMRANSLAAA
ncbi:MAG TPA: hypothetical protein DER01_05420 [Phycisphaerales bacterium]|nr:hypothetical protein [Phycisphaerales bacterium]